VQIVELDVVADLWNLADVVRAVFFYVVSSDLLPAFYLNYVWLSVAFCLIAVESLVDADTWMYVLV